MHKRQVKVDPDLNVRHETPTPYRQGHSEGTPRAQELYELMNGSA